MSGSLGSRFSFDFCFNLCYNIIKIKVRRKNMKILVDEMPIKVEDCPWSSPIEDI